MYVYQLNVHQFHIICEHSLLNKNRKINNTIVSGISVFMNCAHFKQGNIAVKPALGPFNYSNVISCQEKMHIIVSLQ